MIVDCWLPLSFSCYRYSRGIALFYPGHCICRNPLSCSLFMPQQEDLRAQLLIRGTLNSITELTAAWDYDLRELSRRRKVATARSLLFPSDLHASSPLPSDLYGRHPDVPSQDPYEDDTIHRAIVHRLYAASCKLYCALYPHSFPGPRTSHYKMNRDRSVPDLCYFQRRTVSATQFGYAICVMPELCQKYTISRHTVFLCVTHLLSLKND